MVTFDAQMTDWKRFTAQVRRMGATGAKHAVSNVLNDLAFGARGFYPLFLDKFMDIRAPRFVKGAFGVTKSTPTTLRAYTMSLKKPRFGGWIDMQRGGNRRKKYATIKGGRGGSPRKKIRRKARLTREFPNISEYSGANTNQQLAKLLVDLREAGSRGPFVAGDVGDMPWGLWTLGNLQRGKGDEPGYREIKLLQAFDKPKDTKRRDWAGQGASAYMGGIRPRLGGMWNTAFHRAWRHSKR